MSFTLLWQRPAHQKGMASPLPARRHLTTVPQIMLQLPACPRLASAPLRTSRALPELIVLLAKHHLSTSLGCQLGLPWWLVLGLLQHRATLPVSPPIAV